MFLPPVPPNIPSQKRVCPPPLPRPYPFSKRGVQTQQQQVGGGQRGPPEPPDLLAQHGPAEGEMGRGAVGQVGHGQPV